MSYQITLASGGVTDSHGGSGGITFLYLGWFVHVVFVL